MRIIISLLVSLFICTSASAKTIIIPIDHIVFDVPDFKAPKMNLGFKNDDLEETKKEKKNELLEILREEYPTAKKIEISKGKAIIRL